MLVQQGCTRDFALDRRLACTLAAVAGGLNAAAFYAVGFFSANMTGNVSALSDHLAVGQFGAALFYLAIIFAFVVGAVCSTLIISVGQHRAFVGIYALVIFVEGLGLFVLGGLQLWLPSDVRNVFVIPGLAFLMGLQNAVVTRTSDARVRTTHVSGMATDIGIEIGLLFKRGPAAEAHATRALAPARADHPCLSARRGFRRRALSLGRRRGILDCGCGPERNRSAGFEPGQGIGRCACRPASKPRPLGPDE